jgi:hypothetical protein
MPRNASGVYTLPASNPVVPLTVITSQWANTTMSDMADAMTQSIAANGVTLPTANLPMGGFRHTGVGLATQYNHYARADQVQQAYFAKATDVAANAGQTAYTCNLPFGSGGITALVHQQPMTFTPNVINLGPASISVNGGAFAPIVNPDNTAIGANRLLANTPVAMMWNAYTSAWTLIGYYSTAVNTLTSADAQMLTASPPTGNTVLTPIANVANGMVKLDANGKVPAGLLPAGGAILLGTWNAAPGTLPPNGNISGQYYIVSTPGTLTLYVSSGATWVATPTAVLSGDELLWQQVAGQPTGWYYIKKSAATTGSAVTLTPTPSFPAAATVQAWVNAADAGSGFALTNGTRTFTGNVYGVSFTAPFFAGNIYNNGGWKFYGGVGSGFGYVWNNDLANGCILYTTTTASTGSNAAATIVDLAYYGIAYSFVRSPWGVGGVPRNVGGSQQIHLDVYGPGSQRIVANDTTNQVGLKLVAASTGNFIDATRMAADGTAPALGGVPLNIRMTNNGGTLVTAMTFSPIGQVQVGDPAGGSPGSICSTHLFGGGGTIAADFRLFQTLQVLPGAVISSITMTKGQIARIEITGNGGITLPAAVHIPRGGAVYGAFATVIGLYYDSANILASFTPYDV